MPKTLLMFLMAVLFPVMPGIAVSILFLEQAQAGLQIHSDLRMSRAGAYFLAHELQAAKDSLVPMAEEFSIPDPPTPAAQRALSGDTVMAVAAMEDGLRVTILLSDGAVVRGAAGRLTNDFVDAFQSVTNYGLSVYFEGDRVLAGKSPMGPRALPDQVIAELGQGVESVATSVQSRASEGGVGHRPPLMQSVLVALIPVLAGIALLSSLDQGFRNIVGQAVRGDLARASALLRVSGEGASMEAARTLGFDAELIDRGVVLASTIADQESRERLAAIRPPPPTFSTTGSVELTGVDYRYMATRPPGGGVMVLLTRGPEAQAAEFRFRLIAAGILIAIPSLLYLLLLVFATNKPPAMLPER